MAVMQRARSALLRLMPLLVAALLFACMFARITMLACLAEKSKLVFRLDTQSERAKIRISQLELNLSELHDLETIAARAAELGMMRPSVEQIRVLRIESIRDTPAEGGHSPADTAWREGWD